MAARKKSKRGRPRKTARRGRKPKVEALLPYDAKTGERNDITKAEPQTLTQKLHNAEQAAQAARIEVGSMREYYEKRAGDDEKANRKQINGLQNEVGMLRAMIARMTYGGIHVRDIESIGPGAR